MESSKIIRIVVGILFLLVGIYSFVKNNDTLWGILFVILGVVFLVAAFKTPNQLNNRPPR